jgi:AI-2E family transporter
MSFDKARRCGLRWNFLELGPLFGDYVFQFALVSRLIVPSGLALSNVMVGAVVVALLYFTRDILVPIALAILLSFVLAPLVRLLQRLKLPRVLAVMEAVATAVIIAISLATMVMVEVNQLGDDLPRYQSTLTEKIHNLRDAVGRAGLLKNASSMLKNLDRELKAKDQGDVAAPKPSLADAPQGRHQFLSKCINRIQERRKLSLLCCVPSRHPSPPPA